MKIAIAGAGTTGSYAYRLLREEGLRPDIFERRRHGACGIDPCAWATSRDFVTLLKEMGFAPEKYVLAELDHVWMDDVRIGADLMTFNKPALIRDLLEGAELREGPVPLDAYDRVIDATGISRAYLPKIGKDIRLPCIQHRVEAGEVLENRIKLGCIGYAWCFPLSEHGYHIGCSSLVSDPKAVLDRVGWLGRETRPSRKVLCSCAGKIRLTSPHHSQPFVSNSAHTPIWGVGESIGCVAPLACDGVVPGMKSVRILIEHWTDPARYTRSILKEFQWMLEERKIIDRVLAGGDPGVKEAWLLKRNSERMGMQVGIEDVVRLLKSWML